MNARTIANRFGTLAVLATIFAIGLKMTPAQSADSEEISKLLIQAKSHAVQAEDDAATLDTYTRSKISWTSHAVQLDLIREHINSLGKVDKDLADQRTMGSRWQQKAIDQIHPLLVEMASQLTATIKHLNDHPSQIYLPEYREYAHASYEVASRTAGLIRDFVNYDEAQSRAESLEAKLELSEPEKSE